MPHTNTGAGDRTVASSPARLGTTLRSSTTLEHMAIDDLGTLEYKLTKRGFRRDDVLLHECVDCHEKAVLSYVIAGRSGGRDITLCQACGRSRSWRSGAGLLEREEDPGFDLRTFLG